ncbi:SAM-dependent methyltransferase [Corynebacterium kutscheri]|uniref:Methyltransferase family protein n=1 Tax=Corynebacterium kutscheri TaxID=35755 RepID=A0A0F6QZ57_9CORY|nr:class I SAM-dependent methyltransferase [Corynebacterium kutscheri]AKE40530.1 methyltransferase family protein [Corynebacterium kutscheri]VEH05019.1 SAM-dependent methyltransferase [Corynebacterium kutscheri]VEH10925.1 SAM-dependent methyltransferase [Corynebacterium kutscheri]VEH80599.1 SAM-dependent methyltransferase [Corynebacterium kutscheri]
MTDKNSHDSHLQGHWLLASLGKTVLRPGGLGLSKRMLAAAHPTNTDEIVEFGPGVGKTATLLLAAQPARYTGVDPNPQGRAALEKVLDQFPQASVITADAATTGLDDNSVSLVIGEAMLTMLSPQQRQAVVAEAFRILRPGGRYGIHELALSQQAKDPDAKSSRSEVGIDISKRIKVGARPEKLDAWARLLSNAGFQVTWTSTAPMHLLEPSRVLADEGLFGTIKILINLIRRPVARKRVLEMRANFQEHKDELIAVALVATKPAD